MDHFRQIPTFGPTVARHARELDDAGLSRRRDRDDPARDDGHRDHLPQRRPPRQDRGDARRPVGWTGDLRPRHRLVRGGAPRLRLALPARAERYALLEDALQLLRCSGARAASRSRGGAHVPDTSCYPRPLQERSRSSSAVGERRTLGSSPATPTPATCSATRRSCATRWPCSQAIAAMPVATPATVSVSHLSTVLVGDDAATCVTRVERRPPEDVRPSGTPAPSTPAPSNSTSGGSGGTSRPESTRSSSASPTLPTPPPSIATAPSSHDAVSRA